MRWLLWMWFTPMVLFWGWYFASAADLGFVLFEREFHDRMFHIYGLVLGVEPAIIPGWIAKACVTDSFIVLGIFAFARRKAIMAWWRSRQGSSETSLSNAP